MRHVIIKFIYRGDYHNSDAFEKTINYIYRCKTNNPLLVYSYGTLQFPPTCQSLIQDFELVYQKRANKPIRHLWHFVISSLDIDLHNMDWAFLYSDNIARLFAPDYQVCYSFHPDKSHPHFHFIVSTVNYRNFQELTIEGLQTYLYEMINLSSQYRIELQMEGPIHV